MNKNTQYQQNIDIIKGFFSRPILLVTGILTIVISLVTSVLQYFATLGFDDVLDAVFDNFSEVLIDPNSNIIGIGFQITINEKTFSLDLLAIAFGVCFILLFAFGRSKNNNIQGGATFYRVLANIEYVVYFILAICLVLVGIFLFTTELRTIIKLLFTIFSLVAGFFLYILGYSHLKFAKSIKESMNSIYLSASGAKLFGVVKIIFSAITLIYGVTVGVFVFLWAGRLTSSVLISLSPVVLLFVKDLVYGIFALKYNKYIKDVTAGKINLPVAEKEEVVQEVPQGNCVCNNCGNPVAEEDVFCHICGNKVR